jgi:WD40 repeat protein
MSTRLFISYAHRDGGGLAARLQRDLQAQGFDVWLDRLRLKGGDLWTNEIEDALDRAQVVLALLSAGSFTSDTCRAEQGWSLDTGKCVIPVRVQSDCRVPIRLYTRQWIDFSDQANYAASLDQLQDSIAKRLGVVAQSDSQPRYNNAPPLPDNFVDRAEILTALRNALFQDAPNRNIALTALQGMGGIGKTVLAQALCHDEVVQHAYPDGIFWFTIGKESRLTFDQRIEAVPGLHQLLGEYKGEQACIAQYRNASRDKAALIVLDDVWRAADIEPFRTESPRSRLLVTTRDTGIAPTFGAREFTAALPTNAEAREVLTRWSTLPSQSLPPQAEAVITECGNLPLALAMIGAQLKGKPAAHWDIVLNHLRHADLAQIKSRFPEPHTTLFRAIQVSFEALRDDDPIAAQRYLALAVMLEDMAIAPAVQQTLWNVSEAAALETADRFIGLSLAQPDAPSEGIRLHDLQLDYVRAQYPNPEALELIRGAVRLSAHVIEKDPRQFASQLVGRLLPHRDVPKIQQFIDEIAAGAPKPWLRALKSALIPPGTPLLRTLEEPYASGYSVAVTPDGKRAVSASCNELTVWDLETGRELRTLSWHYRVRGVAVTPDGKRAVSASEEKTLKVWDLETGRALRTLEGHSDDVNAVAATPDGKQAVSASRDKTLKVWDLETGRALSTLKGHSGRVTSVAVTPDGKRAVSASEDTTLKVWDLETRRALRTLEGHSGCVTSVAVTPDGKRAVSASEDTTLKVWDLETGHALRTLKGHSDYVYAVAVTPDGKRAVSAGGHTLEVWDLETGRALRTLEGHSNNVFDVSVTPDGKRAVSASVDNTLKVWDLDTSLTPHTVERHSAIVWAVAVTPHGKRAVSASADKTLKVWDLETGRELRTLEGHSGHVNAAAVTPDGKQAVSASQDKTLKVWDLETGRALRTLEGHSDDVNAVAVTPDGKQAVSASLDKTLKVWDLDTGQALRTLEGHSDWVSGVAVTPDGKRAISASYDKTLKVWNLATGRVLRTLEHSWWVLGVAVTPDGKRAVSASYDKTLKVWDLETGRVLRTLEGHSADVRGVAVTPDGKRAVSASADKTLKVWDLATGQLIVTFHCDAPARCCACADQRRIVAGDAGGRVHFLALEEG